MEIIIHLTDPLEIACLTKLKLKTIKSQQVCDWRGRSHWMAQFGLNNSPNKLVGIWSTDMRLSNITDKQSFGNRPNNLPGGVDRFLQKPIRLVVRTWSSWNCLLPFRKNRLSQKLLFGHSAESVMRQPWWAFVNLNKMPRKESCQLYLQLKRW